MAPGREGHPAPCMHRHVSELGGRATAVVSSGRAVHVGDNSAAARPPSSSSEGGPDPQPVIRRDRWYVWVVTAGHRHVAPDGPTLRGTRARSGRRRGVTSGERPGEVTVRRFRRLRPVGRGTPDRSASASWPGSSSRRRSRRSSLSPCARAGELSTDPALVRRFMLAFLSNDQKAQFKLGRRARDDHRRVDHSPAATFQLEFVDAHRRNRYSSGAVYSFRRRNSRPTTGSVGLVGFRVQASPQGLEILDPPPGVEAPRSPRDDDRRASRRRAQRPACRGFRS